MPVGRRDPDLPAGRLPTLDALEQQLDGVAPHPDDVLAHGRQSRLEQVRRVGAALGLAAVLCAGLLGGPSTFVALLVALVVGVGVGAVNGFLVAFRGLEPFIVTLGMLALARGLVYAYGEGIPVQPEAAASFANIGQTTVLGIPILALIWIGVVLAITFALYRTV